MPFPTRRDFQGRSFAHDAKIRKRGEIAGIEPEIEVASLAEMLGKSLKRAPTIAPTRSPERDPAPPPASRARRATSSFNLQNALRQPNRSLRQAFAALDQGLAACALPAVRRKRHPARLPDLMRFPEESCVEEDRYRTGTPDDVPPLPARAVPARRRSPVRAAPGRAPPHEPGCISIPATAGRYSASLAVVWPSALLRLADSILSAIARNTGCGKRQYARAFASEPADWILR